MLRMQNVAKAYLEPGGRILPILDIPEFHIGQGEQVVLIGPSGCGKTTLLHVVAGISRADRGRIVLNGVEITAMAEEVRDRVRAEMLGYVFQTFNLLPGFTALENVLLGMTFGSGRRDPERAEGLLERVGLGHRLHHKPGALSVGEQQRVAVARALANRPQLLLADEPTANIDPANQQNIIDLIRATSREEKITLLLVTHAARVAEQFDRVVNLEEINRAAKPLEAAK